MCQIGGQHSRYASCLLSLRITTNMNPDISSIKPDADKNRLLKACAYSEPDRVPNFEHYVMQKMMLYILGQERVNQITGSDEMMRLRFLHSDFETEAKFADNYPKLRKTAGHRYSGIPWSSAGLPPPDNLELLKATGVDAASPMITWLPQVRPVYEEGVKAYGQQGVVDGWDSLDRVQIPEGRVEKMLQLVDWYVDELSGSDVGVGPVCRSCFCNTYETLGLENFMLKLYDDLPLVEHIMDIFMDYANRIVEGLCERDIDCFWLDDDVTMNSGFLVPPDLIHRLWVPRTDKMLEPLRKKGIPIYMHCCANLDDLLPIIVDLGITAIHPIQPNCNDIVAQKKQYQGKMAFVGNLDLAGVLVFGTPRQVKEDTKKHIEELGEGGGLVVASSHSITDEVPPANYIAMIEATQQYGVY